MIRPPVSVIVPVYNSERFLAEALDSIARQSAPPAEIVVVDDGSTDESAAIAARYPSVRLVRQANAGVSAARNAGLAAATGERLAFLDADDLFLPGKLAAQALALDAHPEWDGVFGHVRHFLASPELADQFVCPPPQPGYFFGTLLARRELFARVGGLDPSVVMGELAEWVARATDGGAQFGVLPEIVLERRVHGANFTLQRDRRTQYARAVHAVMVRRRAAGKFPQH